MPFIPAAIAAASAAITSIGAAVTAAAATVLTTIGVPLAMAKGIAIAAVALAGQLAITAGVTYAVTALTTPKVHSRGSPTSFKADPSAGIPYAFGRTGVGGNIVAALTSYGDKNKFLHYVVALSGGGPIDSIESFKANGEAVTFSSTVASGGTFSGKMGMTTQLGASTDPVLASPTGFGTVPEWDGAHKMTGYAAARWALQYDAKVYPTGTPKPLWVIKGALCYDPRLDSTYPGGSGSHRLATPSTWAWSENPWINALQFIIGQTQNGKRVIGVGAPSTSIDWAAFVEAANIADANSWTIGGQVSSKDDKWQVLQAMAQAGGGQIVRQGALISCVVQTPRSSIGTITGADVIGEVTVPGTPPRRNRINTVLYRYSEETHDWALVVASPVSVSTYVSADGDTRTRSVDMPLVTAVNQGAQLAAYGIYDSRELGPITLPLKPYLMGLKAGDVVTVNEPEFGLNSQDVLILTRQRDPQTGCPTFTCRTETYAKHAAALAVTGTAPPTPTLTGIDLTNIPAPGSGAWAAAGAALVSGGVASPAILVTGASDNATAESLVVEMKPHSGGSWATVGEYPLPTTTRIEIFSVTSAASYDLRLSYRVRGVLSGNTLAINNVTAGTFAGSGAGADVTPDAVNWANVSVTSSSPASVSNAAQTISGISTSIVLTITYTGSGVIKYGQNGGALTTISSGGTITVSSGDTLYFNASRTGGAGTDSGTVTVTNTSDSSTVLDTFTYSCTVSASDVTPDAVNWTNIAAHNPVAAVGSNANQTISGITAAITLRFEDDNSWSADAYEYSKNNGAWTAFGLGTNTLSMSNGDTLKFRVTSTTSLTGTISVYNDTDGAALLDTFFYSLDIY